MVHYGLQTTLTSQLVVMSRTQSQPSSACLSGGPARAKGAIEMQHMYL